MIDMDPKSDPRNVLDKYKGWELELIKEDVQRKTFPFAVLMGQLDHDFNIGTVIRSANGLGAKEIFYYGPKKHFDRRGAAGTYKYSHVEYLPGGLEEVANLRERYTLVALETGEDSVEIEDFVWPDNSLIVVGEESLGIEPDLLKICQHKVRIPLLGSVRSYNAAVAISIAMYDYLAKYRKNNVQKEHQQISTGGWEILSQ